MGTTTKGLRYPESNVLGNTLHTRIKELADDTNRELVSRDTRLDGLDTKTNNTNADLALRGMPIARYGGTTPAASNMPNDSAVRTIWSAYGIAYVPANARTVMVSISCFTQNAYNAQNWFKPMFSGINGAGGDWMSLFPSVDYANVHNNGQVFLNMGFSASSVFNMVPYRGQLCAIAVNAHNDSGSGGWSAAGYMQWSVLFMS
jgi:hypothetical protein